MSLSNHPQVLEVVQGQTFVQAVRQSCTILKDVSLTDDMIRRAALTQAYPRIALILASTTDKDGKGIIPQGSISYEILYREVQRLATSQPYVDDIHRVATALTASYFIKSTPLNSSIQLLPLGDRMETQAIEDLDRLRGQVLHQIRALLGDNNAASPAGPAFYFSGLVEDGRSSDQILIPNGTKGVAVYTLTTHLPIPVEVVVEVPPLLPDLLTTLSDAINQLSIRSGSNILASPNRGIYTIENSDCIPGGALVRLDYISLSPRRVDPTITRELVILNFYLIPVDIPKEQWGDNILETSIPSLFYGVTPTYRHLHPSGPHSILLQVDKGSIKELTSGDAIDTIYLQGEGEGVVSYTMTINGVQRDGTIPILNGMGTVASQVAQGLREVVGTTALIAQLTPRSVQVVPNGNTNLPYGNPHLSLSLTSLPQGVEASTGTSKNSLYPYVPYGPIAVTLNSNAGLTLRRPTLGEEATGVYTATSFKVRTSPRMQAVYDKLDRIERLRGRCNGRY